MADKKPWPVEIRLKHDRRSLVVTFDDGTVHDLAAERLRVLSPSAEVQGHSPEQRQTVPGKRDVTIKTVEPVGNYAVRLGFADGHGTGIYTWDYLARLGSDEALWTGYLNDLAAKGLSRDR